MQITSVKVMLLSYPVPKERQHRNDYGVVVKLDNVIVRVETDEGITGIGAAHGSPEAIKGIVEHELQPALIGEDPTNTERLWEKMYNGSRLEPSLARGYSMPNHRRRGDALCAIAGVDIALWDIWGKLFEEPFDVRDGYVHAHDRPGLGFTLRKEVEQRFAFVHGPNNVY